jgi:hypothetical protein
VSHSNELALIAIGCGVERAVLRAERARSVDDCERTVAFFTRWTRKEAI